MGVTVASSPKGFGTRGNLPCMCPSVPWYLHQGKIWVNIALRGSENLENGSQRVGGEGRDRGLPCFLVGRGHYLLSHPLPETPATQICHPPGSKPCASPPGVMQSLLLSRLAPFRSKKISLKSIKNLSSGRDLHLHQGPED